MRFLAIIFSLLFAMPCVADDGDWIGDIKPIVTPDEPVDSVLDQVIELRDLVKRLQEAMEKFKQPVAMPMPEACDCECISEDRIREICREEIQAVLSVRTSAGKVEPRPVTVTASGGEFQLAPGERLVAIDGVPVNQISSTTAAASGYQVRAVQSTLPVRSFAPVTMQLQRARGVFQRSGCYTDSNGNRQCR